MKSSIFIPKTINVGYQNRSGTYTGKLAYVIYYDEKGKLRKEASWNSWRDEKIPNEEFDNVPTTGFVLNKKVGDYSSGWDHRQAYCRVYDPRNFEFEITIENLLYILENVNSIKGKGLEGEFVYGWDGKDLVLMPVESPDYKQISEYNKIVHNNESIKAKDLIIGVTYLTKDNEEFIVATGGRGGRGNKAFATQSDPAPKFSELGEPGEIRYIRCELKVLADVGLIGMPSVGKSTLLNQISNANPKIASYHFTTLSPNLGLVKLQDERSYVVADLPGLIEGASKGVGLGTQFLKHAMRTRILVHVIDMAASEGRKPWEDYEMIRKEMAEYSEKLIQKKEIVIANKSDIETFQENIQEFKKRYPHLKIYEISAVHKVGFQSLLTDIATILEDIKKEDIYEENDYESTVIYKFQNEKPYTISKENDVWILKGNQIEKLFYMTRFEEEESQIRFARKLKGMGVEEELERLGAKRGDEVQILDYIFIFKD